MMRGAFLALILVTVGVAGCLGDGPSMGPEAPGGGDAPAVLEAMFADGGDHDHLNPSQHELSYRMDLVDHLALSGTDESPRIHALDIVGDLLYAASTLTEAPRILVVDISDPSQMEVVGQWSSPQATGGDRSIEVTEDGQWAFLASEGDLQDQEAGVRMLDVSDPTEIREVAFFPMRDGAHTVDTLNVDGTTFVFAVNYGVNVLEVVQTPAGPSLVQVGKHVKVGEGIGASPYGPTDGDAPTWYRRAVYAHDMRAVNDPEAGPTVYVADAYQGVTILELTASGGLVTRGEWVPGGQAAPWYVHGIEVEHIGDRRIAVVGSELFEDRHVDVPGPLWVLDITDLSAPELLGTWTNPAGAGGQHLLMSPHYFRLVDGRVHLAHHHGGVWVLDVSTPERQAEPEVVGAYLPHEVDEVTPDPQCCFGRNLSAVPVTMDVEVQDGVTFAADYQTGLYALRTSR